MKTSDMPEVGRTWVLWVSKTNPEPGEEERMGDWWFVGAFDRRLNEKEASELVEEEIWDADKDNWLERAVADLEDEGITEINNEDPAFEEDGTPLPHMTWEQRVERKARQLLEDDLYSEYEWELTELKIYSKPQEQEG